MYKVKKYIVVEVNYQENFQIIWRDACELATSTRAKVIILVASKTDNINHIIAHLETQPIGKYSFLFTDDFRIIAIHFRKASRFGTYGQESFFDFVTWLQEKSRSDGHEWAVMGQIEVPKPKTTKPEVESHHGHNDPMVTNYDPADLDEKELELEIKKEKKRKYRSKKWD